MKPLKFRAWTGKQMIYQEKQYLASFIRRVVPQIILDHGGEPFSQHESYLPNGSVIDDYLTQFTGLVDENDKEMYEGDVIEYLDNTSRGLVKKIVTITDIRHLPDFSCSKWEKIIGNIYENPELSPKDER